MEDRRGQAGSPLGGGGLPFPIPMGKAGGGIGGIILIVVLLLVFGGNLTGGGGAGPLDPGGVDETVPQAPSGAQAGGSVTGKDQAFEFAKFVSKDAQDMWTQVFQQAGKAYTRAPVVTFTARYVLPTRCPSTRYAPIRVSTARTPISLTRGMCSPQALARNEQGMSGLRRPRCTTHLHNSRIAKVRRRLSPGAALSVEL